MHALLEPSPEAVLKVFAALQEPDGGTAAAELTKALREILSNSTDDDEAREALTNGVLRSVAQELLRTWRARLATTFGQAGST